MVIAVDFDGTIVEHEFPKIGKPIPFAIETLLQLQKDGHVLLLWTVREGKLLQEALEYCQKKGLTFYAANKNHPDEEEPFPRKLNADMFIDDRNLGGMPDWGVAYHAIKTMMENGDESFENIMMSSNENQRVRRKKKNFFIRLGEMFERDGY